MKALKWLAAILVLCAAGGAAFVWSGLYDISATDQHLRPVYRALELAMERSVERRARDIAVPPLGDEVQLATGAVMFGRHCVSCHGAPGVAPEAFSLGMRPLPKPLVRTGLDRSPEFIFWIVRQGLKMTGMPAFEFRMDEEETWATVAFVKHLPKLSPEQYRALASARAPIAAPELPSPQAQYQSMRADAERGRRALEQYGCVGCHEIPGLVGPEARLGPTLHGIARRGTLGGVLPNTPENMERWLREPQKVAPGTAMPDLGVTPRDARDMAAQLATFR